MVECSGRLTLEHAAKLKSEVKGMIPSHKRIILDLGELVFMDSSGLGTIVGLYISGAELGLPDRAGKYEQADPGAFRAVATC